MRRRTRLRPRSPKGLPSSRALEQEVADALGGRRQPRSGGIWTLVGDARACDFLLECKEQTSRGSKSFTIPREWLDRLSCQAAEEGTLPALVFRFRGDSRKWVILPFELFAETLCPRGPGDGPAA